MGRTAERPLKVNVKKLNAKKAECMDELQAFFACMARKGLDVDVACQRERKALAECAAAAASKPKVRNTVNYHLQRLSRGLRR